MKSILEKIISGDWVSFMQDEKFKYEFFLAQKDAVFILPVIDEEKIILRTEPIPAWYYRFTGDLIDEEEMDQYYTLPGGGIDVDIEKLEDLTEDTYKEITLKEAERELYEECGIYLNNKDFKDLNEEGKIKFIGPIFANKMNTFRANLLVVFLDSSEFDFRKPVTDGTKGEKVSNNYIMNINEIDLDSIKELGDLFLSLAISELQSYLNIEFSDNETIKETISEKLSMLEVASDNSFALVIGRFQPFSNGHLKMIEQLYQKTNQTIIIGIVSGAKSSQDKQKNPLNFNQRAELIKLAMDKTNIPYIVMKFRSGYMPDIVEEINSNMGENVDTIYLACGSDRVQTYSRLMDKAKEEFGINYELIEIERSGKDISATKLRDAIKKDNYVFYNENVPNGINDEGTFEKLKGILLFNG